MTRAALDERGFEVVRGIRRDNSEMPLSAFKALVREQFHMLIVDTEAALAAIPSMLPDDTDRRIKAIELIKQVLSARSELSAEEQERMERIVQLYSVSGEKDPTRKLSVVPLERKEA